MHKPTNREESLLVSNRDNHSNLFVETNIGRVRVGILDVKEAIENGKTKQSIEEKDEISKQG